MIAPARGAVEVKGLGEDIRKVARSEQVAGYCEKYRLVLVTNYREFLTVEKDANGKPRESAFFPIAASEKDFWAIAQKPKEFAEEKREHLREFLKHALLYAAPIREPKDVAAHLAFHAREARARIGRKKLKELDAVREALAESLGLTLKGEKGEEFFRSALVQALFYGIFAAWVFWAQRKPKSGEKFNWKSAAYELLPVPVLRKLVYEISDPGRLKELNMPEVLDWSGDVLNRVERGPFFESFRQEEAVQYFYEPFLEAYDKQLRKDLGVWYTPREIVQYMVERVDQALRSELGIADGLADSKVLVLDPCCGTGAYVVEVLRRIAKTLEEQGGDALSRQRVKKAALERVFGFEILPAPFVISHLQIGMVLGELQAPLEEEERAAVYLTNALTGWEPPKGPKQQLLVPFPELVQEQKAAGQVKREHQILVVLGNPPYNAFAGVSPAEEGELVEVYKEGLATKWAIKKYNLDDLYVRFFRIAEKRITEMTGKGVVCFISNFSYLDGPSFVVMRERFCSEFDRIWLDCLNGDSRETGKLTPEGKSDPSVFSTEYNKEGIRVGTAIATMVRRGSEKKTEPSFGFRQFWGVGKRAELLASASSGHNYATVVPTAANRFSLKSMKVSAEYLSWPRVTELSAIAPLNGLMEKRGGALIDIDKGKLETRMRAYFEKGLSWQEYKSAGYPLVKEQARFDPESTRGKALAKGKYEEAELRRYQVRPFDDRWCYYTAVRPVWNEPRPELRAQCWAGNEFILTRFNASKSPEGSPFFFVKGLFDDHLLSPDAVALPLRVRQAGLGEAAENLSGRAREYLQGIGAEADAELIWKHVLAIGYAPAYLSENEDGIRDDWPRIPLPGGKQKAGEILRSAQNDLKGRGDYKGAPNGIGRRNEGDLLETTTGLEEQPGEKRFAEVLRRDEISLLRSSQTRLLAPRGNRAALMDSSAQDDRKEVTARAVLESSAKLGREIAALLDGSKAVAGVTAGAIRDELKVIAVVTRAIGGQLNPGKGELRVEAGWGRRGKDGAVMPGVGKALARDYTKTELEAIRAGGSRQGVDGARAVELLGERTYDIWLNGVGYWKNVPERVWEYTIGGYQVVKKWLSYREYGILGRSLADEEVYEVRDILRRIAAIILLGPELDANYAAVKAHAYQWPTEREAGD